MGAPVTQLVKVKDVQVAVGVRCGEKRPLGLKQQLSTACSWASGWARLAVQLQATRVKKRTAQPRRRAVSMGRHNAGGCGESVCVGGGS